MKVSAVYTSVVEFDVDPMEYADRTMTEITDILQEMFIAAAPPGADFWTQDFEANAIEVYDASLGA